MMRLTTAGIVVLILGAQHAEKPSLILTVELGHATVDSVVASIGKPESEWSTRVLEGRIEPFLAPVTPSGLKFLHQEAERRQVRVVAARVLEYTLEDSEVARLVFRDDTLWYAVFPAVDFARIAESLERHNGRTNSCKAIEVRRRAADLEMQVRYEVHGRHGVAAVYRDGRHTADVFFEAGSRVEWAEQ